MENRYDITLFNHRGALTLKVWTDGENIRDMEVGASKRRPEIHKIVVKCVRGPRYNKTYMRTRNGWHYRPDLNQ